MSHSLFFLSVLPHPFFLRLIGSFSACKRDEFNPAKIYIGHCVCACIHEVACARKKMGERERERWCCLSLSGFIWNIPFEQTMAGCAECKIILLTSIIIHFGLPVCDYMIVFVFVRKKETEETR